MVIVIGNGQWVMVDETVMIVDRRPSHSLNHRTINR